MTPGSTGIESPTSAGHGPRDIYRLPVEPADIRTMAKLLLATEAFGSSHQQATTTDVADIVRTELLVIENGDVAKRVYFGQLPEAFAPLEKEVDAMIDRLKAKGEYGLYDGDREVEGAVRP